MIEIRKDPKNWKIPVSEDGSLITGYVERWIVEDESVGTTDNRIFTAFIKPSTVVRGRSSVTFTFLDDDGKHIYHTGAKGMMEITKALTSGKMRVETVGFISGMFTFKKQGEHIYLFPA